MPTVTDFRPTPGHELKSQRIAAGVRAKDLAAALRLSYPSLWRLETSSEVPTLRTRQYLTALRELVDAA